MQLPNNDLEGVSNKCCRITTDCGYEIDTDTGYYMPKMASQPLAPPELLNDLVCLSNDCVCATNEQACTQSKYKV